MAVLKGRDVIESLAERFPQLYVAPAEGAQEAHRLASGRGIVSDDTSLAHFATTPEDELRDVDTPAGLVQVAFLKERADFETFIQIVSHKSQPVPIARTVGAMTYRGLADWGKVAQARRDYLDAGGDDWPSEFSRLARVPGAFRAELIVISEGPYSNINAAETRYDEASWMRVSREIRLHHECAHVVCRRKMPDDILPVWDEMTADVVGLICATGEYDAALAMRFLGVTAEGFAGGRLAEYLDDEQASRIDGISREVAAACQRIEREASQEDFEHPFDFLIELKASPLVGY